jgi:subtilisin family serine protease
VTSVAGVNVNNERVGYSSQGPGRLAREKPDLCGYTHFTGSDAFPGEPDSGTSAACPVVAGVVAAVRTSYPSSSLPPAALRSLLTQTATDLGPAGYDPDYGWGVIGVRGLLQALP